MLKCSQPPTNTLALSKLETSKYNHQMKHGLSEPVMNSQASPGDYCC